MPDGDSDRSLLFHHPLNLHRRPFPSSSGRGDLASIEFCRDRAERTRAGSLYGCDGREKLSADLARFLAAHLARRRSDLSKPLSRDAAAAKLRSPRPRRGEGCLGSLRNSLSLLLSNGGQDMHDEPIRPGAYQQPRTRHRIP